MGWRSENCFSSAEAIIAYHSNQSSWVNDIRYWKSSRVTLMVEPPHSRRRLWNLKENDHKNIWQTSQLLRNKHIIK